MAESPELLKKLEIKASRLRDAALKVKQQPLSPYGYRYSGFQRRILAATIDSGVMLFTIIPLSYLFTNFFAVPTTINFAQFFAEYQSILDSETRVMFAKKYFIDEGRLQYAVFNSTWQLFLMVLYCMYFWPRFGATPGKILCRLKVVRLKDGAHLTYKESFHRCMGYLITFGLGIMWALWDKKRQAIHDKMAGSIVLAGLNFTVDVTTKQQEPIVEKA